MEPLESLDMLAHEVIGAAIEVHKYLGPGYLESVYEDALAIELTQRGIRFDRQYEIGIQYKGRKVGKSRLDILVENKLVLELKAADSLLPIHKAQIISYLKASGHHLGLLINFNSRLLKEGIQRIINSN